MTYYYETEGLSEGETILTIVAVEIFYKPFFNLLKQKLEGKITARLKPENKKWFMENKIDLDKLIEELRK